ncbi:MAG: hypothetical protein IJP44_10555 [Bacteroidales bacterium]|nr:hypothetical protein [Bacteroidales bacterium]
MKTKTFVIALFIFTLVRNVYAQEKNYEISSDKKTITVSGDCTINVEEFAPEGVNIYGNLEKGGIKKSKGEKSDLFKTKTDKLNKDSSHEGVDFQKKPLDTSGYAQICITYSKLDECTLSFYCAKSEQKEKEDSQGVRSYIDWSPDTEKKFTVTITKKKEEINENDTTITAPQEGGNVNMKQNEGDSLPVSTQSIIENDSPQSKTMLYVLGILAIVLLCIIVYLLVAYAMLNKRHKKLKESYKQLESTMQRGQSNGRNVQTSDNTLRDFIATQFASINSNLNGLSKEFQGFKGQMSTLQSMLSSPAQTITPHKEPDSNFIDTEIVNYIPESNSFKVGGVNDGIFRIYSKDGACYYTIVNNDNIRREIIGALPAFEKCISIQPSQSGGSMLVPIIDGKLIKDGNTYFVDSNHKLIVQWR